jgi:DNA-binding winged helix-turn-helix (wHTH) protein/TolB-like protein/Tfp pilus assembly protein PilF
MDEFAGKNPIYRFGEFELEVGRRILRSLPANSVVALTPRAFDLLLEFVRRPQVLITKAELLAALWPDTVVEDNNLDHTVFALRQALGERRNEHRYIQTIHRRGYQFTAPVAIVTTPVPEPAEVAPAIVEPPPGRWSRGAMIAVACALVLAIALAVVIPWRTTNQPSAPQSAISSKDGVLAVRVFRSDPNDESQLLADAVTTLLEHRFSAITGLLVIAPAATQSARKVEESAAEFGRRMRARFVLSGDVTRTGQQLRLSATLIDATTGMLLWSKEFDRSVADITAVREEIVAHAAEAMRIAPSVTHQAAVAPVDLGVYELYVQAERLMRAGALPEDTKKAVVLYTRTTVLDPRFARGYLGVAQALMYTHDLQPHLSTLKQSDITSQANAAIDRALELNPALGEAWVARARLIDDDAEADRMFRRGLQLQPNYTVGAMFYYDFLMAQNRAGQAIDVIDRARKLEPTSPTLLWLQSVALMAARSDVATSEQLLRQAMGMEGGADVAEAQLALSLQHNSGQFAEAMRLFARRPADVFVRASMAILYLDMDDLPAAIEVWNGADPPPKFQLLVISQYQRDTGSSAAVARQMFAASLTGVYGFAADSLRDHAVATGDYAGALAVMEPAYAALPEANLPTPVAHEFSIVFAHLLILSGNVERGRDLARALLVSLEGDAIGRPAHWFSVERAKLFALLGENDKAIDELAASQQLNHWSRWWYTGEVDPIFAHLRGDPRFKALVASARAQRATQRALFEEMTRKGEITSVNFRK